MNISKNNPQDAPTPPRNISNNYTNNALSYAQTTEPTTRDPGTTELNTICEKLKLFLPEKYYLLIGDLNARNNTWGDENHNQRRLHLLKRLNLEV